ncbi:DegT/DnrJ/EryC1/StrS family aminotransferase [Vibrio coralliilyticus]|uniref:DegT/DnrJ/EryC1/StrS family aminotransferase n=1 Tax=Vibrio coralliilyticus TaxID=190893 RepID=UPI00148E0738|nr:DegT/DnrJ/EryC1/StrS family aminotransferase [Vibrio coralliilyticus]NOH55542.1 DegT/DnrJ/EryC1/StrS family aminotransferase [Vibrio coralliilyticus]
MEQKVLFKVHMPESVNEPLLKVLHSGFIGQGAKVDEFESKLAAYFGNEKVLTLNSGTSGLHLALRLANVGPGDEVITTAMTCTATNMPILAAGAKIVWADVNPITGLISPEEIEKKITNKTKAIIMVHFGGIPCDIEAINRLAKAHNIKTIEDGAHAIGAEYKNQKVGNHSDFVMFSLQAIKHFTTIDGGLLLCQNEEDYERGKLLRWYGIDRNAKRKEFRCEEDILEYGYKYHMNDICATIGIEQLKYIDDIVSKHIDNQKYYDEALQGITGVTVIDKPSISKSSSWLYTLHVEKRDLFSSWMDSQKIMTSRVHERNDKHTAFRNSICSLPGLDIFNKTQVSIPVGWWINKDDREYIVEKIKEFSRLHLS